MIDGKSIYIKGGYISTFTALAIVMQFCHRPKWCSFLQQSNFSASQNHSHLWLGVCWDDLSIEKPRLVRSQAVIQKHLSCHLFFTSFTVLLYCTLSIQECLASWGQQSDLSLSEAEWLQQKGKKKLYARKSLKGEDEDFTFNDTLR